jgi:septum formation protein
MLILASSSPRRRELLTRAGIEFAVHAAEINEDCRQGELPQPYAERLAREKAHAVAHKFTNDHILAADTIVVAGEQILGKPRDQADAARMLRLLSGRDHQVLTSACLLSPGRDNKPPTETVRTKTTRVHMSKLSEAEISAYIASGEPMDKAGAYAVQGMASRWIFRIEGEYSNVVGLPIALVYGMLRAAGAIPNI